MRVIQLNIPTKKNVYKINIGIADQMYINFQFCLWNQVFKVSFFSIQVVQDTVYESMHITGKYQRLDGSDISLLTSNITRYL